MNALKGFAGATTFLTKIPFPWHPDIHQDRFSDILIYFPWTGAVLGLLLWGAALLGNWAFGPGPSSVLVVFFLVVLTGGLHLDGVADTFDGLLSCREKDRILEIMKDSRIGTHGVLAVFFVLAFKIAFVFELLKNGNLSALMLMPVVGRMMLVLACYKGVNARQEGMGRSFIGTIQGAIFYKALGSAALLFVMWSYWTTGPAVLWAALAFLATAFCAVGFRRYVYGVIHGITGDVLGAICEMSECLYLIFFLVGGVLWRLFI